MNMIQMEKLGEFRVNPSDLVKLICTAEVMASLTTEELKRVEENLSSELNFRHTERTTK